MRQLVAAFVLHFESVTDTASDTVILSSTVALGNPFRQLQVMKACTAPQTASSQCILPGRTVLLCWANYIQHVIALRTACQVHSQCLHDSTHQTQEKHKVFDQCPGVVGLDLGHKACSAQSYTPDLAARCERLSDHTLGWLHVPSQGTSPACKADQHIAPYTSCKHHQAHRITPSLVHAQTSTSYHWPPDDLLPPLWAAVTR